MPTLETRSEVKVEVTTGYHFVGNFMLKSIDNVVNVCRNYAYEELLGRGRVKFKHNLKQSIIILMCVFSFKKLIKSF